MARRKKDISTVSNKDLSTKKDDQPQLTTTLSNKETELNNNLKVLSEELEKKLTHKLKVISQLYQVDIKAQITFEINPREVK